jgi:hypothetical protein
VPEPGPRRAYAGLAELARGTNAFTGKPADNWVTATTWPGADPARTDHGPSTAPC